ncbi:organic solute transporter subunit alpha-like [Amphibalanus amphitrite]|uniref:organic solute transporter subunit alpha-like n=1 Tax=Amphibalanus amphitrite TaxID=1232801 RepID=UPI001C9116B8|nr:organic solute transporter subunit alpha-like [Amphibalanus amphitrite]XP_043197149.1 organic solute transporter subunit alpha-like [Amphibalanus amphitrite]
MTTPEGDGNPPDVGATDNPDCQRAIRATTTAQLLEDLGGYAIALWTIASVIVVILLLLMVRTTLYVNKAAPKHWRRKIVWISSIYPFVCLMCLCSLIVPGANTLLSDVGIIFISIGVSKFVDLCMMYFGGESSLLLAVGQIDVPLAARPLCCCCRPCCPSVAMSKHHLKTMKMLVYQLPFTQSAYCLIYSYLFIANVTSPGQIAFNDAYIYLTVFNMVSTLSAMYGLSMFLQVTKGNLQHYHFMAKAVVMKLTLIFVKFQDIIFTISINYGGVSSTKHMPPLVYGFYIRDIVVLLEMFMLGLLAHRLYTEPKQYRVAAERLSKARLQPLAPGNSDSNSDSDCDSDDGTQRPVTGGKRYEKIHTPVGGE